MTNRWPTREGQVWSLFQFTLAGAALAVLGWFAIDILANEFLVGALFQCAFSVLGLWAAARLVLGPGLTTTWRWLAAFSVLFVALAWVMALWVTALAAPPGLPKLKLAAAIATIVSLACGLSLWILARHLVGLALALVPTLGALYGSVVYFGPRLLLFWIMAFIAVGGLWLLPRDVVSRP